MPPQGYAPPNVQPGAIGKATQMYVEAAKAGTGKKMVILLVIIFIVLAGAGVGFYFMYSANQQEKARAVRSRRKRDAVRDHNRQVEEMEKSQKAGAPSNAQGTPRYALTSSTSLR